MEKVSVGCVNFLNIARVANLRDAVDKIKKSGFFTYCADAKGKDIYDLDFSGGAAVVVGSEEKGVRKILKSSCDVLCKIPMLNNLESLNVSVAGAVVIYEIFII